jgi:hypothetical protein
MVVPRAFLYGFLGKCIPGIMTATVKKYPSRIKYEENNPTVSFRVPLEDYEQLKKIAEVQGLSFREIIMIGVGKIETNREEERRRIEKAMSVLKTVQIGRCSLCGEPLHWDLTRADVRQTLADAIKRKGFQHVGCRPR